MPLLHRVAEAGQVALLELLLAKSGNVNAAAKDCATPLHIAAAHGHLEVVRALLDAGATVDLRRSMAAAVASRRSNAPPARDGRAGTADPTTYGPRRPRLAHGCPLGAGAALAPP